jgi:hypothetical protein
MVVVVFFFNLFLTSTHQNNLKILKYNLNKKIIFLKKNFSTMKIKINIG